MRSSQAHCYFVAGESKLQHWTTKTGSKVNSAVSFLHFFWIQRCTMQLLNIPTLLVIMRNVRVIYCLHAFKWSCLDRIGRWWGKREQPPDQLPALQVKTIRTPLQGVGGHTPNDSLAFRAVRYTFKSGLGAVYVHAQLDGILCKNGCKR